MGLAADQVERRWDAATQDEANWTLTMRWSDARLRCRQTKLIGPRLPRAAGQTRERPPRPIVGPRRTSHSSSLVTNAARQDVDCRDYTRNEASCEALPVVPQILQHVAFRLR